MFGRTADAIPARIGRCRLTVIELCWYLDCDLHGTVHVRKTICLLILVIWAGGLRFNAEEAADLFDFFAPSPVGRNGDRASLVLGGTIARVVPGSNHTIAVFSATAIQASGDRLIAWMRDIVALKRSEYVPAIGRFSNPPQLGDLAALTLDDRDIDDVYRCRAGRCGIKLAPIEIDQLQRASRLPGVAGRNAIEDAFRRVVLRRVETYLVSGQPALPAYEDHGAVVSLQARFSTLLDQSPFIQQRLPAIALALVQWPRSAAPQTGSFLHWSKEQFGAKPVISVTHVLLLRRPENDTLPEAVVIGKQVFATHYTERLAQRHGRHPRPHIRAAVSRVSQSLRRGRARRLLGRAGSAGSRAATPSRRASDAGDVATSPRKWRSAAWLELASLKESHDGDE